MKSTALLLIAMLASFACSRRTHNEVIVKVLYDPQAPFAEEIGSKLQAYRDTHPVTAGNQPIDVHEAAPGKGTFQAVIAGTAGFPVTDTDIVVIEPGEKNLSAQVKGSMENARNACEPTRTCLAFIGSWVPAERRDAVQRVFDGLTAQPK